MSVRDFELADDMDMDMATEYQPLSTSDWKLEPGNLVSLALDARACVEPLLDRAAVLEARLMRPHRVAALVDVVDGDWVQVMLVGVYDGPRGKNAYEPAIQLAANANPTLVVYPLRRHTLRVVRVHSEAASGFRAPVLDAALAEARVTMLGVALHGARGRTTASRRWDLEDAARAMYAAPEDIRLCGRERVEEEEEVGEEEVGLVHCAEVWPEFELGDVWEPDALLTDLAELDEIELRKHERDAQLKERDAAREHGAAMLRSLKLLRHWQSPAPGESVKTFLRRTFQRTQLDPIEDSDTEDSDKDEDADEAVKPRETRTPSRRSTGSTGRAVAATRTQSAGLIEGTAYCVRWAWHTVALV